MKTDFKTWVKKKKWDILFFGFFFLILFVPSIRMPVVSTVQRLFAFSPSELSEEKQKEIAGFDWLLTDLEGNEVNFSQSKGKIIVVNIWATWCPPCVAEMPSLQKLYDAYKGEIDFYFVSHESVDVIQRFLTNKGYTFPVFIPLSAFPTEMAYDSLPTTFIIDQSGKIRMKEIGAHDWYSKSFIEKIELMKKEE